MGLHFLTGTITGMRSRLRVRNGNARPAPDTERASLRVVSSCYLCGGIVEAGLARLGSTVCHDCRRGRATETTRARL